MGKVAKIAAAIGLVALAATGVGAVLGSAAAFALFGGSIGAGALAAAGTATAALLANTGLTALTRNLSGGKKAGAGAGSGGYRSTVSLNPNEPQWIVIGETAVPTKLLYFGTSGATNENLSMIFCHAACVTNGFVSLSINNISTAFPTPAGAYAGILAIETADGTQTANPFTTVHGGVWGASDKGQGLTLSHFRWAYDQTKLVSGLPQNIQFVCKGLACYDPRFDSTRGGSGTMRAQTPSTWAYSYSGYIVGRNPACVELSYRLGFVKAGRVFAGMGEDPANIDYASYIAAANVCDEVVNGKPRYRIDGILSIGPESSHNFNLGQIHASCGGKTIDVGGLLGFWVAHDDTATSVMTLTDDDWRGNINWQPLPEGEIRNTARGSFIDPAKSYIAQPYGEIAPSDLRALDNGVELVDSIDFGMVQDIDQARRLASIRLRESRQGVLTGPAAMRALALSPQSVVTMAHARTGWTAPTFRVESLGIQLTQMQLRLRAVQASDYADVANTSVSTPGSLPTLGFIGIPGVLAFKDFADWSTEVSGTGKPDDNADVTAAHAPALTGNLLWELSADVAGTITSVLPADRRFKAMAGTTDVSTTTGFVLSDISPGVALTVNNTPAHANRGVLTLANTTMNGGTAKLTATLPSGVVIVATITVTKTNAVAGSTGGAGATIGQDFVFIPVTSGSHAAISDELTVRSDGSSHVRIALEGSFVPVSGTANANIASKFSYATTSGGALTDLISEVNGAASIYITADLSREEGAISHPEATFTMPAANTDYYFKAQAKRITGSVNINFTYANFTVRQ